jgi:predicted SnoaL-like aldol condensation-catalyzing enzyme
VSASGGSDGTGGSAPLPLCEQSVTDANKSIAEEAMRRLFIETDASAFTEFWADPYLQHNPVADSGVDAFWGFFESQVNAGNPLYSMERVVGECDLVLFHGSWGTGAMFDMLRVENGKLVEHWDASSSGLGGTTATGDTSLSATSKQLVLEFTDHLIADDPEAATGLLSDTFMSHNGDIAGGGPSFASWWNGRGVTYTEVHHVIADGEMVFTMTEGTDGGQGYGFYDLYRVVAGKITEHWDGGRAMQAGVSGLGIF